MQEIGQNLTSKEQFASKLAEMAAKTGQTLDHILKKQTGIPANLKSAMEYMLQGGGKRIRSALVMWACQVVSGTLNHDAEVAASSVEMIHTYSLIHDDLPAMDNDDLRRGRPSCHKKFNEATAILAGDALLTLAFEVIADEVQDPATAVEMIRVLSQAAGPAGMIAGQVADMASTHAQGSMSQLVYIHRNKTAQMFSASAILGALAANASKTQIIAMHDYGMKIGMGFQIADDLLDVTASASQLGKTAGKDVQQGKLTYPALIGVEESKQILKRVTADAIAALDSFGDKADILRSLANELLSRTK